jgi:hypothetical protein
LAWQKKRTLSDKTFLFFFVFHDKPSFEKHQTFITEKLQLSTSNLIFIKCSLLYVYTVKLQFKGTHSRYIFCCPSQSSVCLMRYFRVKGLFTFCVKKFWFLCIGSCFSVEGIFFACSYSHLATLPEFKVIFYTAHNTTRTDQ